MVEITPITVSLQHNGKWLATKSAELAVRYGYRLSALGSFLSLKMWITSGSGHKSFASHTNIYAWHNRLLPIGGRRTIAPKKWSSVLTIVHKKQLSTFNNGRHPLILQEPISVLLAVHFDIACLQRCPRTVAKQLSIYLRIENQPQRILSSHRVLCAGGKEATGQ
jgi:hypothetical protein